MANLITTSLTYSKESLTEYFIKPLFLGEDIRAIVDVHTDVKSSKKLDLIDALENITKAYAQGASFTPSTGITITQKTVTTYAMKAEVRQNGRAFANYCKQAMLKSGVQMNDITDTLFEKIILEIFFAALKADFNRQIFFGDTLKENVTSDIAIGTADTNYNVYDGFWTWIKEAITATTIPAAQYVNLNSTTYLTTAGVARSIPITVTGTSGTCNITVNGTAYLATFDTDLTTTAANWVTAHGATIAARWHGATVTSAAAVITIVSNIPGVSITATISAAVSGNLSGSAAAGTAVVAQSTMKADGALAAFRAMYNAMPAVMKARKSELVFMVTAAVYDNYMTSLESATAGSEVAYYALKDGQKVLAFRGIPIKEMLQWDSIIDTYYGNEYPNRCLLVIPKNLVVGTDSESDMLTGDFFYDLLSQDNVFRIEYMIGTQFVHPNFIVAAY